VSARTAATTVLILVGLYLVLILEATGVRRLQWVAALCAAMLALYLVVLIVPATRDFFMLVVPGFRILLASAVGTALAIGFLWTANERFWPLAVVGGDASSGGQERNPPRR
jgi:cation-transporting P-type ATPase E